VCSGGRYDNLIGLVGGRDIPACGFAFNLDAITAMVKPLSLQKAEKTVSVKVTQKSRSAIKTAFELAAALRTAGLTAEFDFCGGQLEARWTVDVQAGPAGFILKDVNKKTQKLVKTAGEVINIIGGFSKLGK
jgi:histidyl-tRNA synthetase